MTASELRSVSQRALATYGLEGAPLEDLRVEAPRRLRLERASAYRSIVVAPGQTLELSGDGALIASALTVEDGAQVVVQGDLVGYFDTVTLASSSTPNGGNGGRAGNGQPTTIPVSAFGPGVSLQVIPNDNNGGLCGVGGSPRGSSGASGTAGAPATVTLTLVS